MNLHCGSRCGEGVRFGSVPVHIFSLVDGASWSIEEEYAGIDASHVVDDYWFKFALRARIYNPFQDELYSHLRVMDNYEVGLPCRRASK